MYLWHEQQTQSLAKQGRTSFAIFAAGIVFAIAALTATGQSLQINFAEPPSALEAGAAWQTHFEVSRAGEPVANVRPEVVFTDAAGVRHVFLAHPDAKKGVYHVKIQLPDGGRWSYEVRVGKHVYSRGEVHATKPPLPF